MEHSSSNSWDSPTQQEIPSTSNHHGLSTNGTRTQRMQFWVAAGFSWAIWALAVAAATHDQWLAGNDGGLWLEAGNDSMLYFCNHFIINDDTSSDGLDDFCNLYRVFTAAQFAATVTCSIAVALLALAAFRPAVAGRGSVKSLSIAGAFVMIAYVVFQLGAVVLLHLVANELEDLAGPREDGSEADTQFGETFWISVAGLTLALFTSIWLQAKAKHAGDGPFYGAGNLWVGSGCAWVVWVLAVIAATHDEWLLVHDGDFPVRWIGFGGGAAFKSCDEAFDEIKWGDHDDDETQQLDALCDFYRGFMAAQLAATVTCSIAIALLALAAFRPAGAGCASVKSLARAGGVILIVYGAFQAGAVVLAHFVAKEWERIHNEGLKERRYDLESGPTFWIAVAGLVLSAVASFGLLGNAKNAKNGPFYGGGTCGVEKFEGIRHSDV